jgi:hypothetical protein
MNPEWTKTIPSETICEYYLIIFYITTAAAVVVVLLDLYVATVRPSVGFSHLIRTLPILVLSVVNSMFLYILCSRTLLK